MCFKRNSKIIKFRFDKVFKFFNEAVEKFKGPCVEIHSTYIEGKFIIVRRFIRILLSIIIVLVIKEDF